MPSEGVVSGGLNQMEIRYAAGGRMTSFLEFGPRMRRPRSDRRAQAGES